MYDLIVDTYNNPDDNDLTILQWNIAWSRTPEPARFQLITFEKAQNALKSLSMAYKKAYSNWKKSGWHKGLPTKQFKDFVGSNNYLDYLHCLLQESDGLLSVFKSDLPFRVFLEGDTVNQPTKRQKKNPNTEALEQIAVAQAEKAKCMAYSAHCKQYAALELLVEQLKQQKRKYLCKLKEDDMFVGMSNMYIKSYLAKLKKKRAAVQQGEDDKEIDLYQASQDTCATGDSLDDYRIAAEAYIDCLEKIELKEAEMSSLKIAMNMYLSSLKGTWDEEENA